MRTALLAAFFLVASVFGAAAAQMQVEGRNVDVPVCGGLPGLVCPTTDWCDYPEGATCGAVDHYGTCRKRPDICTKEYLPVCGCNGQTYPNACEAAAAGFDVAHPGKCR